MLKQYMRRIGLLFLIIFTAFSCQKGNSQSSGVQDISVEEAYKMMTEDSSLIVIDVRTPGEYTGPLGHVKGTQLKPVQQIEQWASELESAKDKKIVLICRSGNRSGYAARFLQERGFSHLYNVMGGMMDWNRKGLPVEKAKSGEQQ